jgi:hypothetical protein
MATDWRVAWKQAPGDRGNLESLTDAVERVRIRTAQIDGRIRELRERSDWLTENGLAKGSTPEQAMQASHFADIAQKRASEAAERTVIAHLHAATAHDRAARLLEDLAAVGIGDPEAKREKARDHRTWADGERAAARGVTAPPMTA